MLFGKCLSLSQELRSPGDIFYFSVHPAHSFPAVIKDNSRLLIVYSQAVTPSLRGFSPSLYSPAVTPSLRGFSPSLYSPAVTPSLRGFSPSLYSPAVTPSLRGFFPSLYSPAVTPSLRGFSLSLNMNMLNNNNKFNQ